MCVSERGEKQNSYWNPYGPQQLMRLITSQKNRVAKKRRTSAQGFSEENGFGNLDLLSRTAFRGMIRRKVRIGSCGCVHGRCEDQESTIFETKNECCGCRQEGERAEEDSQVPERAEEIKAQGSQQSYL